MKKTLMTTVFLATALAVTGCATTGSGEGPATAFANAPAAQLSQALPSQPETLWIPARYLNDGKAAFYINGKQYVAPGGNTDVLGFLPADYGYLVAVDQDNVPDDLSYSGSVEDYLVYYKVDDQGKTLKTIGAIPDAHGALVAKNGIYAVVDSGNLLSHVGYNTAGEQVSGPQGVIQARPAPDGGWYFKRFISDQSLGSLYGLYHQTPAGAVSTVRKNHIKSEASAGYHFVYPQMAYLNRPPIAPSARTGYWLSVLDDEYSAPKSFALVAFDMRHGGAPTKLVKIGNQDDMSLLAAAGVARRTVVTQRNGQTLFGMQFSENLGRLDWGFKSLDPATGKLALTPIFNMFTGITNVMRQFLGKNNSGSSLNSTNDVYAFLTPDTTVVAMANKNMTRTRNYQNPAYDLARNVQYSGAEVTPWLVRYGISR